MSDFFVCEFLVFKSVSLFEKIFARCVESRKAVT